MSSSGREKMYKPRFLLVGTVSNVEKELPRELRRTLRSLENLGDVDTFLVESDSKDYTNRILEAQRLNQQTFNYKSMGELLYKLPNRVERIRFCRNQYVDYIRKNYEKFLWDFIFVADLDGMNSKISSRKIRRAISNSSDWDACFANQTFGYYDLYALRSKGWLEHDCFEELERLKENNSFIQKSTSSITNFFFAFRHFDQLRVEAIYSKMRILRGKMVGVESAFGGFAIYKPEIFLDFDYSAVDESSYGKCEHLDLHRKCVGAGFKLFIDPKLTNCHVNEYNLNKLTIIRFLRELKKHLNRTG